MTFVPGSGPGVWSRGERGDRRRLDRPLKSDGARAVRQGESPLTLEATLGDDDGPGALAGHPASVARDGRGRFFVVQQTASEVVKVYDASGAFLRDVGGPGEGPSHRAASTSSGRTASSYGPWGPSGRFTNQERSSTGAATRWRGTPDPVLLGRIPRTASVSGDEFTETGTVDGLGEVLRAIRSGSAWTKLSVLLSPTLRTEPGEKEDHEAPSIIEALRAGRRDQALHAASSWGQQGAS